MAADDTNLIFLAIIVIVIAAIVGLFLPKIASDYSSKEVAFKEAAAREIAMIINVLCGYNQEVDVSYELNLEKYTLDASNGIVAVSDSTLTRITGDKMVSNDPTIGKHPYVCNKQISQNPSGQKKITFKANNERIVIA